MFRSVQTTQERRANGKRCANGIDFEGYLIHIRSRRSSTRLQNSWDEVYRSNWRDRSWKQHRRTQYK